MSRASRVCSLQLFISCCSQAPASPRLTWLDPSGLEEVLQRLQVVVLVLQGVAHIVPQLGVVLVHLKRRIKEKG